MLYTTQIVDGDEVRSVGGSGYELISGKDKVRQDINMSFTTDIRKTTGLGSQIEDAIGQDSDDPATSFSDVPFMFEFQMRVKESLDQLKRAQRKYQYSYRVPSELIHEFSAVQIWAIKDDSRNYRWEVGIQTVDGTSGFSVKGKVKA